MKKLLKNRKGFTLIELIVVIAIIAILAAVLIPRFTGFTESGRQKSAISDTRNVLVSLEALIAEGKTGITQGTSTTPDTIEGYAGKDFAGTVVWASGNADTDTFTYTVTIGTYSYKVAVNGGEIDTAFEKPADASATESSSSALT